MPGGPPPVRPRNQPWGLDGLSEQLKKKVEVGSLLMTRFLELCVAVALACGFFFMEHPEDPYIEPYPRSGQLTCGMRFAESRVRSVFPLIKGR